MFEDNQHWYMDYLMRLISPAPVCWGNTRYSWNTVGLPIILKENYRKLENDDLMHGCRRIDSVDSISPPNLIFNRLGVAETLLQTHLSFID